MRNNGNGQLLMDWRIFVLILTVMAGSLAWAISGASERGRYEERIDQNAAAISEHTNTLAIIGTSLVNLQLGQVRIAAKLGVELH